MLEENYIIKKNMIYILCDQLKNIQGVDSAQWENIFWFSFQIDAL